MLTPEMIRARLERGRHVSDLDVWSLLYEVDRLRGLLRGVLVNVEEQDEGDEDEAHVLARLTHEELAALQAEAAKGGTT